MLCCVFELEFKELNEAFGLYVVFGKNNECM